MVEGFLWMLGAVGAVAVLFLAAVAVTAVVDGVEDARRRRFWAEVEKRQGS